MGGVEGRGERARGDWRLMTICGVLLSMLLTSRVALHIVRSASYFDVLTAGTWKTFNGTGVLSYENTRRHSHAHHSIPHPPSPTLWNSSHHTPSRRPANGRWSHLHDMATPYEGVHSAVMTLPSARDHFSFQQPQDQPGLAVGQDGAHHPPPPSHPDLSPDGSLWDYG